MKKPELLSPAGTLKNMRYAFAYGADAVYAGQPRYSLRVRNNEFSKEEVLGQGIEEAHAAGKLFFLASNIAAHNNKLKNYLRDLEPVIDMGADGPDEPRSTAYPLFRPRHQDAAAVFRAPRLNHAIEFPILLIQCIT